MSHQLQRKQIMFNLVAIVFLVWTACMGYLAGQTLYSTVWGLLLGTSAVLGASWADRKRVGF